MKRAVIGGLIIVAFAALGWGAFRAALTPYTPLANAKAASRTVQIIGQLDLAQAPEYDAAAGLFSFGLTDASGETLPVVYRGVKPTNFEHAQEVVAVGQYADGAFWAARLLVKCPSKYREAEAEQ